MGIKSNIFLSIVVILMMSSCRHTSNREHYITSGQAWLDTDNSLINAHGGGVLYYKGLYYWYGEYKGDSTYRLEQVDTWECWRADARGVSCYSSPDLSNWKFEGIALKPVKEDHSSDLHPSQVMERPKVIYNEKTGKFVLWMHVDSPDYGKGMAGVAVADRPTGPFRYLGSLKPNGFDCRDQTLFKDTDGKAYHICSTDWNKSLMVSLLSDDYTKPSGRYKRMLVGQKREAPAVFKRNGTYYLLTSGCTGWDPNEASYATADSLMGEWRIQGNPCKGPKADKTFEAQSTFVLKIEGQDHYIAMFDRWNKQDLIHSSYIWLPIDFDGGEMTIEWKDRWNLNLGNTK